MSRILYFDIETAPNLAAVWDHFETNVISYDEGHEWYMLCFAWQWEGEKKVHSFSQLDAGVDFEHAPCDDSAVVARLWDLFDEADYVIAHNGDRFDIRKAQARFAIQDLGPTSPFRSIDTKRVAKRHFAFNSNSLDNLGQTLGLGRKVKHPGYEMWQGCMRGERKWWDLMVKYNRQDITLLRQVYLRLRPFISNHPQFHVSGCNVCGGTNLQSRGVRRHATFSYPQYQCQDCGSWVLGAASLRDEPKPTTRSTIRR